MKTNSLFFKIRLAFAISSALILLVFGLVYFTFKHYKDMELKDRLMHAMRITKHAKGDIELISDRLESLELKKIDDAEAQKIFYSHEDIHDIRLDAPFRMYVASHNNKSYLIAGQRHGELVCFEDEKHYAPIKLILFGILIAVFAVLVTFYQSILNGLKPINDLQNRLLAFAKNKEILPAKGKMCDELLTLSNSFEKSALHLKNIENARALFIRNIAHELKTPLQKGYLLAYKLTDNALLERFVSLFNRFEFLINELLQIERLNSSFITLKKEKTLLEEIINEEIKNGLDAEAIVMPKERRELTVDIKLFGTAIKNLLDNAIKHSSDKKATIYVDTNSIQIANQGLPLDRDINQLYEPFVKADEASSGLGLGLYIAKQIIQAHGFVLKYNYQDGWHIFSIDGV